MLTQVLEADREKVPPPKGDANENPLQALIFDSHYDSYKGVIAYVRVMEGTIQSDRYSATDGNRDGYQTGGDWRFRTRQ